MSKALTREEWASRAPDLGRTLVELPQYDAHVYVRKVTAKEFEDWQDDAVAQEKKNPAERQSVRALFVALCVCDENGKKFFNNATDIAVLGDRENETLEYLWTECRRVNGMDKKFREDAEKN